MGLEPLTLKDFDALADDGERNAAIARALGHAGVAPDAHQGRRSEEERCYAPCAPYYTGGDSDPFGNWGLLAEVMKALPHEGTRDWILKEVVGHDAEGMDIIGPHWAVVGDSYEFDGERIGWCEAATPHRAACRALVAAGLVPRGEEAPDAQDDPNAEGEHAYRAHQAP